MNSRTVVAHGLRPFALVLMTLAVTLRADAPPPVEPSSRFVRGDANADNLVNITDSLFALEYIFRRGPVPPCADAADVDDNGRINVTDGIVLLEFLFSGDASIPEPFPACGVDPTDDDQLDCESLPEAPLECLDRSATVAWSPPDENADGTELTDLAGYVVHHATDPDELANDAGIDVGDVTAHRFADLEPGTHYFAISAYDEKGNRSELSAAVSKTIR